MTLVECLLEDNLIDRAILNNALIVLKEFDLKLLGDFFIQEEKDDLNQRILNVIDKVNSLNI